ncbi:unnamed protein product [Schistosoma rodhaini]|uniref:RRM domain-containing protein n=1 Tax=Schistosoma rodhaini TaxID=6188 RepID=A0AA85F295_9TREM|nr:unnamed protein product [Schistosoma rodhaini]
MSRTTHKIYVGNLPPDTKTRDIENLFSKYGPIAAIDLKAGQRRGPPFAFVEFEDELDASDAVRGRDGYNFDGYALRVELPRTGGFNNGNGGPNPNQFRRGGFNRGGGGASGPSRRSDFRVIVTGLPPTGSWQDLKDHMREAGDVGYADVFRDGTGVVEFLRTTHKIYVGNLPPDTKTRDIENLFSKYGPIAAIDLKAGQRRGPPFAFVEFEDELDASDAVRGRDGYNFDGYALRVELPRTGGFNNGNGGPNPNQFRRGGFNRGGGGASGPSRRSDFRVIVTGLPPTGSWQDLKDHMREAGDVGYADVFRDGTGVVEFLRYEDMKYAIRRLDDSKFRSHEYGPIAAIDLKAGQRRGPPFAFVEFEDELDASDAVRGRDGYNFDGYALRVELPRTGGFNNGNGGPNPNQFRRGGFNRGGGGASGPSRRSDFRVIVTGLPPTGSWQDLKDHMREAGDVGYADVFRDGTGVVEFLRYEDMKYAIRRLDDSKFRSHEYGPIAAIDLKAGQRRGPPFAFVEFEDELDASDAVRGRDGYNFDGYALRVELPRTGGFNNGNGGPNPNQFRRGGFNRGGGGASGPSRRSDFRVIVTGLPPTGSWQDLKDHMREAGDVGYADVFRDGTGVVEFLRYEDMKYAIRRLDDSKFRSHELM